MKKIFSLSFMALIAGSAWAQSSVSTNGSKYSVLEDVTGAWCQFCPDGTVYQGNVMAANPKVIGVALHNSDKMSFADGNSIMASPNVVCGYPGGLIDRKNFPTNYGGSGCTVNTSVNRSYWAQLTSQQTSATPTWDIKMNHGYNPTTRQMKVMVIAKSLVAQTGSFNINAWIIEDHVVGPNITGYNQVNYYNTQSGHTYYNAGNPAVGFDHRHVERAYLGGVEGTTGVIANNPGANQSYTYTYTYTLPAKFDSVTAGAPTVNTANIYIVGMVMVKNTDKMQREILNAVEAKLTTGALSVADLPAIHGLELYPNPAKNMITVRGILDQANQTVKVNIINSIGQLVNSYVYHSNGSIFGETINTESYVNGVYRMLIVTEDGRSTSESFVIAK
ncbi:MAG: T9SS type A sorting domain-containing protein [Bacteroidetes bacterium]|nr:T9SS type A sorting domain-containing protein [Bacteroidota bacterium]